MHEWSEWVSPSDLADRLDAYFLIRNTTSVKKTVNSKENSSKPYAPKRNSYDSRFDKTNQAGPTSSFNRGDKLKTDDRSDRPSVSCYGCGKPGVTKPRCPNCKPAVNKDSATFSNISLHSCSLTPNQSAVLKLAVNGIWGTACADSGASHSIAGETLYLLLQKEGANFQKTQITMSLADGHKSEVEVYTTSVVIRLEERVIRTQLIILPYAKGNRTLLGMDFLQKAGIVLNLKHRNWFFSDSPHRTYDFVKEAIIQEVQSRPNLEENTCLLRDDEGANPCESLQCGPNQECDIDRYGIATCQCPPTCEPVMRPVCGSDGHTYHNDCDLNRQSCLMKREVTLAYRGECGERGPCHKHVCHFGSICVVKSGYAVCECPTCSEEFEPVCGTDGISYTNVCKLKQEGCDQKTDIDVAYTGLCSEFIF
ncbi:agrin [Trichonephila clavata]|uniref:Agrin n=1 Tax=Trichonephila clavata TaxID=2740835 RepID=A0A8X6HXZ4_TRICU|nr:agrin [Trichonephila clavata]